MKIKLVGNPLHAKATGPSLDERADKIPTRCTDRELRTTKWHPSYAIVTFQVRHEKPVKNI